MHPVIEHPWELTFPEAHALQEDLRGRVETDDRLGPVRTVAGVDIAYDPLTNLPHRVRAGAHEAYEL